MEKEMLEIRGTVRARTSVRERYYLWGGWMGGCRRAMHRQHLVLDGERMARSLPANVRKCRPRAIS